MFPQLIETMYSPALTSIQTAFAVSSATAAQALSVFFIAFAFGVIFWGLMCDQIGRRYAMLSGLAVFMLGASCALLATGFHALLYSFAVCAFGAAVGSICTQTMIRDSYKGKDLAHVFSIAAASIGISPVIGLLLGSWLTRAGGYEWVFASMLVLVALIGIWCLISLPETKPAQSENKSFLSIARKMCGDIHIWFTVAVIALFNVALFSYYSIAPFMFERMGLGVDYFGHTGFIIALGSILGSCVNGQLLKRNVSGTHIVYVAGVLLFASAISVYCLQSTAWFYMPMAGVSLAFGLAIPHIMGKALLNYQKHFGSAGALLGTMYYLLIGGGLEYAGRLGNLGTVLVSCSLLVLVLLIIQCLYKKLRLRASLIN